MATKIEWTDETWNPVTGCTKVSAGCKNCYAERMSKRLAGRYGYRGRHGLYEMMTVNNAIKKQIVKSPDAVVMRQIAMDTGMVSLLDHGSDLVKQGVSTVAEVLRVSRGIEEQE